MAILTWVSADQCWVGSQPTQLYIIFQQIFSSKVLIFYISLPLNHLSTNWNNYLTYHLIIVLNSYMFCECFLDDKLFWCKLLYVDSLSEFNCDAQFENIFWSLTLYYFQIWLLNPIRLALYYYSMLLWDGQSHNIERV